MSSLDICDLFNKNGSDKDRNGYLQVYYSLFNKISTDNVTLLEIGNTGSLSSSLFSLRDYFVNGRIIGINSEPYEIIEEPRIETYICDPTDREDVEDCINKMGGVKFNIIIDNRTDNDVEQMRTLRNFYPYLNDDGFYIIEGIGPDSRLSKFPSLVGCVCNHNSYFFAGVKNNVCVIQKHLLNTIRKIY